MAHANICQYQLSFQENKNFGHLDFYACIYQYKLTLIAIVLLGFFETWLAIIS